MTTKANTPVGIAAEQARWRYAMRQRHYWEEIARRIAGDIAEMKEAASSIPGGSKTPRDRAAELRAEIAYFDGLPTPCAVDPEADVSA